MRVRVVVVVGSLDRGGTEGHLLAVLPRLARRRTSVMVFALRGGGSLEAAMGEAGIPVITPAQRRRGIASLLRRAVDLVRVLRRERPDVVHFFLPEAYLVGAPCSLLVPGIRRVMSRRSLDHYQRKYPGVRTLERVLHRRMDAILGNSLAVVRQLLGEGAQPGRTALIPNGIDPGLVPGPEQRAAARGALEIPLDALVIVCVANLTGYKGHADLLCGLATVQARLPAEWVLLCAGRDDGLGPSLAALADMLGISGRVRWLGEVCRVAELIVAADIGVLASHEEGFSNSLLEYMAAGLAVVATDVGGNPEALNHGDAGRLVAAGSATALGEAIADLARHPLARSELGTRARFRAERVYPLERCVQLYESLYRNLADDSSPLIPDGARITSISHGTERADQGTGVG